MRFKSILFITYFLIASFAQANNSFSIKTVVIDAGHGGKDPGASGAGKTREKDIALAVALKLGDFITKNFPDVNVIYTRKTDVFLELHERAEIANQAKADLFIAVHCNASPNPDFYGTSTYVLGLHRTEANLEVAKRENAVILLEEDRDKNYEFDPNSPEGHIIMSMKQNAFLDQSIDLASKVENQLEHGSKRKSLGVKQAGFYVLYKTTMPSLLAEIGFISNPEEEKFLQSPKGQEQIANALLSAFREYKAGIEGGTATTKAAVEEPAETPVKKAEPKAEKKPEAKNEPKAETKNEPKKEPEVETVVIKNDAEPAKTSAVVTLKNGKIIHKPIENSNGGGVGTKQAEPVEEAEVKPEVKTEPKPVAKEEPKPVVAERKPEPKEEVKAQPKAESKPVVKEEPKPVVAERKPEPKEEVKAQPKTESKPVVKEEPKPVIKEDPKPVVEKTEPKEEPKPVVKAEPKKPVTETKPVVKSEPAAMVGLVPAHQAESGTLFKVQLFALKGEFKEYSKVSKQFSILSAEELSNGLTRYYGGNTKSYAEAKKLLAAAKGFGHATAYIVGFKDGVRMSADQMKAFE